MTQEEKDLLYRFILSQKTYLSNNIEFSDSKWYKEIQDDINSLQELINKYPTIRR